jgi:dTDP-4-dehydrorhamnose 3,5-epimerase
VKVVETEIPGVVVLEPKIHADARGTTFEGYNRRAFREATGLDVDFVQDNFSKSRRDVLRGMHYQIKQPQGKLIRAFVGEIFDVAVDLRRSSPTFGKWVGRSLSAENNRMMWIPPGFGHGFITLSDSAEVMYKMSDFWAPQHERAVLWSDPQLAIRWPLRGEPVLSPRDAAAPGLSEAELYA